MGRQRAIRRTEGMTVKEQDAIAADIAEITAKANGADPLLSMEEDLPEGALAVVVYHPSAQSRLGPAPGCSGCLRVWVE